jgi:hypothetical protein
MARRKHHKKSGHKRRPRVGALGLSKGGIKDGLMLIAGATVGIIGGRMLNAMLVPATGTPTAPPTIIGVGEMAIGGMIAVKSSNPLVKGAGVGFAGNGGLFLLGAKGLGLLPATVGYGPDPMHRPSRAQLQGFREVPKIGAFPKPGAIGSNRDRRRMASIYAGVYG